MRTPLRRASHTLCLNGLLVGTLLSPHLVFAQNIADQILNQPIAPLPAQEASERVDLKTEQENSAGVSSPPVKADESLEKAITPSSNVAEIVTRPDDDLLIFSLNLRRIILFDALLTYEDLETGKYYIPLQDFFDSLEFPIEVDLDSGTASGWFLEENRKFALDLSTAKAQVGSREYTLTSDEIERHEDGIYASLELLQKWFPITLEVSFTELAVIIKSLEPLPIEQRLVRDERRQGAIGLGRLRDKEYPLQDTKAPLLSFPFINTNTQLIFDGTDSVDSPVSATATTLASGIFLGQDALVSVNTNTQGDQNFDVRASLGLKDPDRNLLGLGISEYEIGDVSTVPIPLLTGGGIGRGIAISGYDIGSSRGSQSGIVQIRGELPVGFQVDLVRNGQLLEFLEEPDENGEYVFDVDVFPGLNVFELVFYGPEGQKETREERFFIPTNPVKKGSFGFRTGLIQDDTNLFTNRETPDEDAGEFRFTAEAEYGLTDTSSLFASYADLSVEGARRRFGLLRYSQSFKGIRSDLSYAVSGDGGQAASIRLQSVFRGIRWQIQHDEFRDFQSEETESSGLAGELAQATNIRASGLLPLFKNTPFTFNFDRLANEQGNERISWQASVTKNIRKLRVTAELDQEIEDNQERETDLNFQLSSRYEDINLRGNLTYELEPELVLNNVSLNADWRIRDNASFRFAVSRSGSEDPVHTLTVGASREFKPVRVGFNTSYNDDNEFRAFLTASMSIGYDPFKKKPFNRSKRIAGNAQFVPRVFYDRNNNETFDEDDEWLEGIGFSGVGVDREAKTNEQGYVLLHGVPAYTRATLELNTSTLPDPYQRSARQPEDYILRPSQIVTPEYPVVLVGEIDGEIFRALAGQKQNAQSINVQILSRKTGEIIQSGTTEFDGFLFLEDIPVGQYDVRIDPEQLTKLGFCEPPSQGLELTLDEPFSTIDEIVLWPQGTEGRVNIILAQSKDKDAVIEEWRNTKSILESQLQNAFERGKTPYAYIVNQDDNYYLLLHNMIPFEAQNSCEVLKDQGVSCAVEASHNICPEKITEITQANYHKIEEKEEAEAEAEAGIALIDSQ